MRKDRVRVAGGVKQLVALEYLCREFGTYLESEVVGATFERGVFEGRTRFGTRVAR
jgi:hypothetical protein